MSALAVVPAPSTELAEVLSPSQVSTFRDCAARWYFKYALGMPDKGSPALALGSSVDTAIKATWHNKLDTGVDLPVADLVEIFAGKWADESSKVDFTPKQNKDEMGKQGAQMIDVYMREAEPSIHPQAVDYHVEGTIAGVHVQGFIDLVEADGTVVDLKTAGRTPSAISSKEAFQLTTYAQSAKDLDINGKGRIDTLVKLKSPKLVRIEREINLSDFHYLRSIYPLIQEQMRSGLYAPNRDSFNCGKSRCPYARTCELEYGGTVSGSESDDL